MVARTWRILCFVVLSVAWVGGLDATSRQQAAQSTKSVWDGIYSVHQATRGRVAFETHCARCHTEEQALTGPVFQLHWEGHTVASLFRKIRETMPADGIQRISDAEKLDVMTFVLAENGFPAGEVELVPDPDVLAGIEILPKAGGRPLPSGAVVQVTGCLTAVSGDWLLTHATEPVATMLELEPSGGQALSLPTGNQRFQLLDIYPSPASHSGQRVRVQGFLIRDPKGDRINVVSLAPSALPCAAEEIPNGRDL